MKLTSAVVVSHRFEEEINGDFGLSKMELPSRCAFDPLWLKKKSTHTLSHHLFLRKMMSFGSRQDPKMPRITWSLSLCGSARKKSLFIRIEN